MRENAAAVVIVTKLIEKKKRRRNIKFFQKFQIVFKLHIPCRRKTKKKYNI